MPLNLYLGYDLVKPSYQARQVDLHSKFEGYLEITPNKVGRRSTSQKKKKKNNNKNKLGIPKSKPILTIIDLFNIHNLGQFLKM